MHIIIEGIDHCGKDTLINGLLQQYGGRIVHSTKPTYLSCYDVIRHPKTKKVYDLMLSDIILQRAKKNDDTKWYYDCFTEQYELETSQREHLKKMAALYTYQDNYFENIFNSMVYAPDSTSADNKKTDMYNVFYNRLHLGEYVYGTLYRNYTTSMAYNVFKHEAEFINKIDKNMIDNYYIILLLMHNPSLRQHDEDAFDFSNGELEQSLFLDAFNYSKLNKVIVYVDTPEGNWREPKEIQDDISKYIFTYF